MARERTDVMKAASQEFRQFVLQLVEKHDLSPIEITRLLHSASDSWDAAVITVAIDDVVDQLINDVKKVEARNAAFDN
jgi:predicted nucleic acid-binding protein